MGDAETDLSLIVTDMAANFFPWNNPTTNLSKALPWIQAVITTILSLIPIAGRFVGPIAGTLLTTLTSATQAFTAGGFQELQISMVGNDAMLVFNLLPSAHL